MTFRPQGGPNWGPPAPQRAANYDRSALRRVGPPLSIGFQRRYTAIVATKPRLGYLTRMIAIPRRLAATSLGLLFAVAGAVAQRSSGPVLKPGYLGSGVTLLPNGWRIAPAGRHVSIGDLPLAMVLSPDGQSLIVSNNGYEKPSLRVFDLDRQEVTQTFALDDAWLGLAWHPDGKRLYSSGAASNSVVELTWTNSRLAAGATIQLSPSSRRPPPGINRPEPVPQTFRRRHRRHAGRHAALRRARVRPVGQPGGSRDTAKVVGDRATAGRAVHVRCSHAMARRFSCRSGAARRCSCSTRGRWRRKANRRSASIPTRWSIRPTASGCSWRARTRMRCGRLTSRRGRPPSRSRSRCFRKRRRDRRRTRSRSHRTARSSPSPMPTTTTSRWWTCRSPGRAACSGFIPTGWYPTGVLFSRDGRTLFVLSGKGLTSLREPARRAGRRARRRRAVHRIDAGGLALDRARRRTRPRSRRYTKTVYALTPYTDATRLAPAAAPAASPIPRRVGDSRRRSSTCSTSSARTAPTTRSSATSIAATAIRRSRCSARTSRRTRTRSRASSSRSTTSTSTPRSATTAMRSRPGAYATDIVEKILADQLRRPRRGVSERRRRPDAERVRQHRGAAERLHLGRVPAGRQDRAQLRRVRRTKDAQDRRRARPACRGSKATCIRTYPPFDLNIPGQQARRHLARGVPAVRGERPVAGAVDSPAAANDHTTARAPASRRRAR